MIADPIEFLYEEIITSLGREVSNQVVRESIEEVSIEAIWMNFFEKIFTQKILVAAIRNIIQEASHEILIELIFEEKIRSLGLELFEPLTQICIQEERGELEAGL